jgi:anti-sigma B factor antagonist
MPLDIPLKESHGETRMNNLHIKERQVENVIVLDMDGNMRIGEGGVVFHETIRRLLEEGERRILLNLAGVDNIDSSGLGELIASRNVLKKNDGQIKLLHLTKRVRDLMVITKLLTVFDVYESEPEAIDSFENPASKLAELQPALV